VCGRRSIEPHEQLASKRENRTPSGIVALRIGSGRQVPAVPYAIGLIGPPLPPKAYDLLRENRIHLIELEFWQTSIRHGSFRISPLSVDPVVGMWDAEHWPPSDGRGITNLIQIDHYLTPKENSVRRIISALLAFSLVVSLSGCLNTVVTAPTPGGESYEATRAHLILSPRVIDADECPRGIQEVEVSLPLWGIAVGILTIGILVPMNTSFTCNG
jgi:hypothetical protein